MMKGWGREMGSVTGASGKKEMSVRCTLSEMCRECLGEHGIGFSLEKSVSFILGEWTQNIHEVQGREQ